MSLPIVFSGHIINHHFNGAAHELVFWIMFLSFQKIPNKTGRRNSFSSVTHMLVKTAAGNADMDNTRIGIYRLAAESFFPIFGYWHKPVYGVFIIRPAKSLKKPKRTYFIQMGIYVRY